MKRTLHNLCLPIEWICSHFPHIPGLRKAHLHATTGTVVAVVGVIITKSVHEPFVIHVIADFFGYTLHAIGVAPILKGFEGDHP
jgi:hypothetical protein